MALNQAFAMPLSLRGRDKVVEIVSQRFASKPEGQIEGFVKLSLQSDAQAFVNPREVTRFGPIRKEDIDLAAYQRSRYVLVLFDYHDAVSREVSGRKALVGTAAICDNASKQDLLPGAEAISIHAAHQSLFSRTQDGSAEWSHSLSLLGDGNSADRNHEPVCCELLAEGRPRGSNETRLPTQILCEDPDEIDIVPVTIRRCVTFAQREGSVVAGHSDHENLCVMPRRGRR